MISYHCCFFFGISVKWEEVDQPLFMRKKATDFKGRGNTYYVALSCSCASLSCNIHASVADTCEVFSTKSAWSFRSDIMDKRESASVFIYRQ